jgi:hypothetical protein
MSGPITGIPSIFSLKETKTFSSIISKTLLNINPAGWNIFFTDGLPGKGWKNISFRISSSWL